MKKKILLTLSFLLGLAGFCAVPIIVGIDPTFRAVREVGWLCVVLVVVNKALALVLPAIGWTILMRGEGLKVPLADAVRANFMGWPLILLTPSLFLGGEPLKLLYIAGKHGIQKRRVLPTLVVGKFQELTALIVVTVLAAGIAFWKIDLSRRHQILILAGTLILLVPFIILLVSFVGRMKLGVRFIECVAALGFARRRLARLRSRAREMEALIHEAFATRWKVFLAAQSLMLLSSLSILVRPWVFFWFLPWTPGSEHIAMMYIITNLAHAVTIVPGSLGVFEGGLVGYFKSEGLQDSQAAAFCILTRIADVTLAILGAWLGARAGLSHMLKKAKEAGSDSPAATQDARTN